MQTVQFPVRGDLKEGQDRLYNRGPDRVRVQRVQKMLAWRKLNADLEEGRRSGEEKGRVPAAEVRAHFEERYGNKNSGS